MYSIACGVVGFLACIDDVCVLAMNIIIIDRTQFKHTAESLGKVDAPSLINITKVKISGENNIFHIYSFQCNLFIFIVLH